MNAEYFSLVMAAVVLILVLTVSFMCIQLYDLRKAAPPPCVGAAAGAAAGA